MLDSYLTLRFQYSYHPPAISSSAVTIFPCDMKRFLHTVKKREKKRKLYVYKMEMYVSGSSNQRPPKPKCKWHNYYILCLTFCYMYLFMYIVLQTFQFTTFCKFKKTCFSCFLKFFFNQDVFTTLTFHCVFFVIIQLFGCFHASSKQVTPMSRERTFGLCL